MPAYLAGVNDAEVGGLAGYRMPFSPDGAKAWVKHINEESDSGKGFFFALSASGATHGVCAAAPLANAKPAATVTMTTSLISD